MKSSTKKRNRMILILIILFFILTGGYAAFANKDTLINSYNLVTKTPSEYYTYIEQYGLYRLFSAFPEETDTQDKTLAYDISSKMILHHKELNSVLDTALGFNLKDLENTLGIPLQSVSFDVLLASKAHTFNETVGIRLNDTKLITFQLFLDAMAKKLSLRIPELSEAYLTQAIGSSEILEDIDEEQYQSLTKERMERIVNRYMELYFRNLGTVTINKKVPLSLNTIETECNLLTVTFTQEEAKKLFLALADTAKSDEDILALLPSLHVTKEQYMHALENVERMMYENLGKATADATLQLKLYLDSKGHIVSRELISFGQSALSYTFLKNQDYREYEINMSYAATNHELHISGTNRKLEAVNQGELALRLHAPSITSSPDLNLDVTYEGLHSVTYKGRRLIDGTFTLSTEKLAGIQITSEFSTDMDQQLNTTAIRLGASPLITINSTGTSLTDYPVTFPEDTQTQFDSSRYEEYLASMDGKGYLSVLSASLGIDPETLLDLLTYGPSRD